MNQGKLEVAKQEMARVNVNILGISKLKWTGGVNLNQHSSVLAWRIPGTGEPVGLPSMGSHRVGHD